MPSRAEPDPFSICELRTSRRQPRVSVRSRLRGNGTGQARTSGLTRKSLASTLDRFGGEFQVLALRTENEPPPAFRSWGVSRLRTLTKHGDRIRYVSGRRLPPAYELSQNRDLPPPRFAQGNPLGKPGGCLLARWISDLAWTSPQGVNQVYVGASRIRVFRKLPCYLSGWVGGGLNTHTSPRRTCSLGVEDPRHPAPAPVGGLPPSHAISAARAFPTSVRRSMPSPVGSV